MEPNDQRRKANQLRFGVVLVLLAAFALALIFAQRILLPEVERAARPTFEGKLERSRTPISATQPAERPGSDTPSTPKSEVSPSTARTERPDAPVVQEVTSPASEATPVVVPMHRDNTAAGNVPVSSTGRSIGGKVRGRITLLGAPPAEKPIPAAMKDPGCGKFLTNAPTTRFYVVGKNGGLGDVFVYLKEGVRRAPRPSSEPVLLDQKNCEYVSYILGLQAGQKLVVRNSDPVFHNVHPTPATSGNKERNFAQMPGARDLEFVFKEPELFLRFKCDVHPWMFAYVCVVEHPFFAVTAADGTFEIPDVPPGDYVIEAVHRKAGQATQQVSIRRPDEIATANFEFSAR